MENLNLECDLMKLVGSFIANVNGKRSVVIPIDDNDLYEFGRKDESRALALRLVAYKSREIGQFGDTHIIKQSMSKVWQEKYKNKEKPQLPILGNGKEFAYEQKRPEVESIEVTPEATPPQQPPQVAEPPQGQTEDGSDLPF